MMKTIISFTLFLLASTMGFSQTVTVAGEDNCCENTTIENKYGSLSDALQNKEKVTVLDLSMQTPKLTAVPKEVAQLPNLICLDVSFNRVSSIPNEIVNCTSLTCINLSGNQYLQTLPSILKKVPNLKVIYLQDMQMWSDSKKVALKKEFSGIQLIF
jgi:predicted rRNA methylase YqxC with S4 and FtsJ domains